MKLVLSIIFILILGFGKAISTGITYNLKVDQSKDKYLTLQINKYESQVAMNQLLQFLNSQDEKITTAIFNYENRYLTVYYNTNLGVDDICRMVRLYYNDFIKISGTDL